MEKIDESKAIDVTSREGVIKLMTGDAVLSELMDKPLMAVETKLETEGTPRRYPDITKPKLPISLVAALLG